MKFILSLVFLFTTSSAFACDDHASTTDGNRTVASAKAETGKTSTHEHKAGETCSCGKDANACKCDHEKNGKMCGDGEHCEHQKATKGKTTS